MKRLFLLLCLSFASLAYGQNVFYVYADENGKTRMSQNLPPEYAQAGYRVVNAQGVTVRVVPPARKGRTGPALSADQRRRDKVLLGTYNSVTEIKEAMTRHIEGVDAQIYTTGKHIEAYERNLQALMAREQSLVKSGQAVPKKLLDDIQRIERDLARNRDYITRLEQQKLTDRKRYEEDMARYAQLR